MDLKDKDTAALVACAAAGAKVAGPTGAAVAIGARLMLGNGKHKKVVVNKEGIDFHSLSKKVLWEDVRGCSDNNEDSFTIKLRGGIEIECPPTLLEWNVGDTEGATDEARSGNKFGKFFNKLSTIFETRSGNEFSNKFSKFRNKFCKNKTLSELDCSNLDASNSEKITAAISDVLWAHEFFDSCEWDGDPKDKQDDACLNRSNKRRNEYRLFFGCANAYLILLKVQGMRGEAECCINICFDKLLNRINDFYEFALSYLDDIEKGGEIDGSEIKADIDIKEVRDITAELLSNPPVSGMGVMAQARLYDSLRNARACGKKFRQDEIVKLLMSESDTNGYRPLGDQQWARRRKKIVCTDKKTSTSNWKEGLNIPDVMVMDAQDIIDYNFKDKDRELKFEINHPQNGVVYVQHPMQQNVYIDVKSFHSSLLDRKYTELIKLLDALGATSINCEVENSASDDEKRIRKVKAGVHVDVPSAGEASAKGEYRGASSKMNALYKKLQKHIENRRVSNESPHVPDGLLFYFHEDDWKNLAENVLKGRRIEEETTLTYRENFNVTGQNLVNLVAKLKSEIPGYEFSADADFSHEFEEELKQLQSTVWHYRVKFGEAQSEDMPRVGHSIEEQHRDIGGTSVPTGRAESILQQACKNCAQSEYGRQNGCINAGQRATLEALAKKCGIDDLHLEELIAKAFDTAGGMS